MLTRYPLVFKIPVKVDAVARLDGAPQSVGLAGLARLPPVARVPPLSQVFSPFSSLIKMSSKL